MSNLEFNWDLQEEEFHAMVENEPFICMFSGGKDCGLALAMACEIGKPIALLHCVQQSYHKSIFHSLNREVIEHQARAMGIPAMFTELDPWYNPTCVSNLYRSLKERGAKSVVFGCISGENNVAQLVGICRMANLSPRMPLWKISREKYFEEMKTHKINSIITSVNEGILPPIWLKRQYNEQIYEGLLSSGINPFGENGEYNTTLVDCDLFRKPLTYEIGAASCSDAPVVVW